MASPPPKKTVTVITMLYKKKKDTKAMVHSTDGNTDFFDNVAGVLQGPYLFMICLNYVL